jgi:hypothetical protein
MTDYVDDGDADHLQNYYILWRYTYVGAAPLRQDSFDSIYFRTGSETTTVRGSGPSLSSGPQASLWKAPGFEGAAAVLAVASIVVVTRTQRRR